MNRDLEISGILKIGLILGYLKKDNVIGWADFLINKKGCTNEVVIELSISGSRTTNEIIDLLSSLSDEFSMGIAKSFFLTYFKNRIAVEKNMTDKLEEELLNFYHLSIFDFNEDEKFAFSVLESDYSLRRDGYGKNISIDRELGILLNQNNDSNLYNRIITEWFSFLKLP